MTLPLPRSASQASLWLCHGFLLMLLTLKNYEINRTYEVYTQSIRNELIQLLLVPHFQGCAAAGEIATTSTHEGVHHSFHGSSPSCTLWNQVDDRSFQLYTIQGTRRQLHTMLQRYFLIPKQAISHLATFQEKPRNHSFESTQRSFHAHDLRTALAFHPPQLHVLRYENGMESRATFALVNTQMDRFPQGLRLNDSWNDSRRFFDHLHAMTLSFTIGLFMPQLLPLNGVLWDFNVQYDFSSQGQIDLVVDFRKTKGSDLERTDDTALADVCILCCTFLYECILLFRILSSCQTKGSRRLKEKKCTSLELEEDSTMGVDAFPRHVLEPLLERFQEEAQQQKRNDAHGWDISWFVAISVANLVLFVCSIQSIHRDILLIYDPIFNFMYAAACMALWITFLKYLEFNHHFLLLNQTLRHGLPRVLRFLVGVFPIFAGYVVFGTIVFGLQSSRFQSITTTARTLFAVANGDEIQNTFSSIGFSSFVGEVYLYSFIILFSYVVLMVCIGIIEESFFTFASPYNTIYQEYHLSRTNGMNLTPVANSTATASTNVNNMKLDVLHSIEEEFEQETTSMTDALSMHEREKLVLQHQHIINRLRTKWTAT